MNPDTIGCVWTGEFDLNTLRVDGDIFESGKKKLRIEKYPDTRGRHHTYPDIFESATSAIVHTHPANSTTNPEKNKFALQSGKK